MYRLGKKFVAMLLVAVLLLGSVVTVRAAEEAADPQFFPLGITLDEIGATGFYDPELNVMVIFVGSCVYVLFPNSNQAIRNNEPIELAHIIYISPANQSYISLEDFLQIMEWSMGHLSLTIATAMNIFPMIMQIVDGGITGMTVAIVDATYGFTWTQGFGYACTTQGIPVDENTIFGLASISKVMTAMAVMQLVEEGVVGLDSPIVNYLPGFSLPPSDVHEGDYANITVRMLLSHSSGIFGDISGFGGVTAVEYEPEFMNNFLENLSQFPMSFPEGLGFDYTNNAFTLLGVMVAYVSGYGDDVFSGFESVMQQHLFGPLGMTHSTFVLDDNHWPYVARPYENATTPAAEFLFYNALPTAGLFSSAYDMARFMHMVLNGGELDGTRVVRPETLEAMLTPQDLGLGDSSNIMLPNMQPGLGFIFVTGLDKFVYTGHAGTLVHYHSDMVLHPESGLGVIVSHNSMNAMGIERELAVILLQTAVLEATGSLNIPELPPLDLVERDATELARYVGYYFILGADRLARVIMEDGNLYLVDYFEDALLQMFGEVFPLALRPQEDGSFVEFLTGWEFYFYEFYEDYFALIWGPWRTHVMGTILPDPDAFMADDDFEQWLGLYLPYVTGNHRSVISSMYVFIADNGMAATLVTAPHIPTPSFALITPAEVEEMFSLDDYGNAWMELAPWRFVRAAQ